MMLMYNYFLRHGQRQRDNIAAVWRDDNHAPYAVEIISPPGVAQRIDELRATAGLIDACRHLE